MAVLPGYQGRGIGTALVDAARQAVVELGSPALFLEGAPATTAGWDSAPVASWGSGVLAAHPRARVPGHPAARPRAADDWNAGLPRRVLAARRRGAPRKPELSRRTDKSALENLVAPSL